MSDQFQFQNGKKAYRCFKTFLVGLILLSILLLAACGSSVQQAHPLIYGVWSAYGQPMTSLISLSQDGKSKIVVGSSSTGLTLLDFTTKHNYSSPFSADGNYAAAYDQDSKGEWDLNILQTFAGASVPIYQRAVGNSTQPSRYIEGFSPSNRYFAYSIVDSNTGMMTVEVYDLQKKTLLNPMPSSYFVDFLPQNDQMIILSLGPSGKMSGVQSVSLPDETQTSIFQPGQDEQIGALIASPDGKYLYYSETNSGSIYRRSVAGGDRQLVYQFTSGDQHYVNFDQYGNYLMLITSTSNVLSLILVDNDLKQVLSLPGIASTTIAFSPDGKYMAFQAANNDKMVFWLADLQSKKYFQVSDTGKAYQAEFTADSQYLVYQEVTDSTNNVGNLQLFNLNTDGNEQIATDVTSYMIESGSLVYTQANTSGSSTTTSLYSSPINKLNSAQLLLGPENGILRFIQ